MQFCDAKKQQEKQHLHFDENKLLISLAHQLIYINTIVSPSVVTTCIINKETRDCQSVTFFSTDIPQNIVHVHMNLWFGILELFFKSEIKLFRPFYYNAHIY